MRSQLGKECRKLFRQMMATKFPAFRGDKGQIVPQGRCVWTRQDCSGIWFHILLVIHSTQDKFTIEAAWDFDGKLPDVSDNGADEIFDGPCGFRTNYLWSGYDHWWPLVLRPEEFERVIRYKEDPIEKCLPLVGPAVWNAAEKMEGYLIPAFEEIIQKHGDQGVAN